MQYWHRLLIKIRSKYQLYHISDHELQNECFTIAVPRLERAVQKNEHIPPEKRVNLLKGTANIIVFTEFRRQIRRINHLPRNIISALSSDRFSGYNQEGFSEANNMQAIPYFDQIQSQTCDVVMHAATMNTVGIEIPEYHLEHEDHVIPPLLEKEKERQVMLESVRYLFKKDQYAIAHDLIVLGMTREQILHKFPERKFSSICKTIDLIKLKLFEAITKNNQHEFVHLLPKRMQKQYAINQ